MQRLRLPALELASALTLAILLPVGLSAQEDPTPPDEAESSPAVESESLDSILDLVREQRKLIEKQQETISALEGRLEKVESLALSSHNRLEELDERPPDLEVSAAVETRLAELEASVQELPEKADVVSAGEFPGSFRIPGTDAALKIGGQVRFTAVQSFDALGSEDRFVTSSIPIEGTEEAGKESRVAYITTPSRLNFDLRTPTGVGSMRAFVEADYAGPENSFRLRHAFGQWQKFLIGQTWSTFADPEAEPDGIDFEGLNAISLFRQPEMRWTTPIGKQNSLSIALESPRPDVTNAAGLNQVPDIVVRFRREPERMRGPLLLIEGIGHAQAAVLVRQVRAEPASAPNTTVARGASVSTSAAAWPRASGTTRTTSPGRGTSGRASAATSPTSGRWGGRTGSTTRGRTPWRRCRWPRPTWANSTGGAPSCARPPRSAGSTWTTWTSRRAGPSTRPSGTRSTSPGRPFRVSTWWGSSSRASA